LLLKCISLSIDSDLSIVITRPNTRVAKIKFLEMHDPSRVLNYAHDQEKYQHNIYLVFTDRRPASRTISQRQGNSPGLYTLFGKNIRFADDVISSCVKNILNTSAPSVTLLVSVCGP
jgi:hypothetical protein